MRLKFNWIVEMNKNVCKIQNSYGAVVTHSRTLNWHWISPGLKFPRNNSIPADVNISDCRECKTSSNYPFRSLGKTFDAS